jgi:hypothetical protein
LAGKFVKSQDLPWQVVPPVLIVFTLLIFHISTPSVQNYKNEVAIQSCVSKVVTPRSKIWSLNAIYLYWREDYLPSSPLLIHPSTILMPGFLKVMPSNPILPSEAIDSILKSRPKYVIRGQGESYLDGEFLVELNDKLSSGYSLDLTCQHLGIEIFKEKFL